MSQRTEDAEAAGKTGPSCFKRILLAGALTCAVPAMQWLVSRFVAPWIGSLVVVLCVCLWYGRAGASSFLPRSAFWKALVALGGVMMIVLLAINIWSGPVSQITGQARSPLEVIDVILLVPIAEELIFRGLLWALFERNPNGGSTVALAVTSLLFGVEHLGYWAQAGLPLPPEAALHALSMVGAGILFGALRWRSRSLAVPMAVHMLANGAILLAQ